MKVMCRRSFFFLCTIFLSCMPKILPPRDIQRPRQIYPPYSKAHPLKRRLPGPIVRRFSPVFSPVLLESPHTFEGRNEDRRSISVHLACFYDTMTRFSQLYCSCRIRQIFHHRKKPSGNFAWPTRHPCSSCPTRTLSSVHICNKLIDARSSGTPRTTCRVLHYTRKGAKKGMPSSSTDCCV
jgi:hypothetical protein